MTAVAQDLTHYRGYINGRWIDAAGHDTLAVENPATAEPWATVTVNTADEIEEAIATSFAAQKTWAALPNIERAKYLHDIARRILAEKDHLAKLLVKEQGKTLAEAGGEVADTANYITYAAEAARRIQGELLPSDSADVALQIHRVPYGVTLGLCAYNYPLALIGRKIGPALVTGNTMIIKPHEATPVTASEFCRIIDEAGLPPGVINLVTGDAQAGATMVADPRVRMVTVTGSVRAGQHIMRGAAENLTAVSLELGGKAPFIVMDDADVDKAAEAAVIARFANCGQVCICSEVALVHEKVADRFAAKVLELAKGVTVGDPMTDVRMGPSVTAGGVNRMSELIGSSVDAGAEVLLGGGRPTGNGFDRGNWFEPTVMRGIKADHAVVKEEIFGPVLPIMSVGSLDEAIAQANLSDVGLSAYLWTEDYRAHQHAIRHLEVGTIFINQGISGFVQGYHNGHKRSGLGGEDGVHGLEGYLQKRTVYLNHGR
ncbi:MAG: aldehyde dehydrogenase family protein [Planctomycetota bacterium]